MQPTEKYYEHDAYRREAVGHILAAEPDSRTQRRAAGASRWTARCFTPRAAASLPTGAP